MFIEDASNYEITKEVIEHLKIEAIKANYHAKVASEAYNDAVLAFWKEAYKKKIGDFSERAPVACSLRFSDRLDEINVFGIHISYDKKPRLDYFKRIKSGKWGKSKYSTGAEWALNYIAPSS